MGVHVGRACLGVAVIAPELLIGDGVEVRARTRSRALDNGRRLSTKLLRAVVARLLGRKP
jgi:hypothetical protein